MRPWVVIALAALVALAAWAVTTSRNGRIGIDGAEVGGSRDGRGGGRAVSEQADGTGRRRLGAKAMWTLAELGVPDTPRLDASGVSDERAFVAKLLSRRTPVVITGLPLTRRWPVATKWTPAYLTAAAPTLTNVLANSTGGEKFFYVDNLKPLLAKSGGAVTWTQPYHVLPSVRAVEFIGQNVSAFGHQMYFSRTVADVSPLLDSDVEAFRAALPSTAGPVKMWLSSPGVTARLHHDNSDNLFVQARGHKTFFLVDPRAWRELYMFSALHPGTRQSQVDPAAVNATRFPRFERALERASIARLEPGDTLWLPAFWFHDVRSEGACVSVMAFVRPHHKDIISRASFGHALPLNVSPPERQLLFTWIWLAMVIDAAELTDFPKHTTPPSFNRLVARASVFVADILASRYAHLDVDPILHGAHAAVHAERPGPGFCPGRTRHVFLADPANQRELTAMRPLAETVAREFGELEPGARELNIANYVEELAANFVGALDVARFLDACFVRPVLP